MTRTQVLTEAEFDPKLRLYLFLRSAGALIATVAGIALLPVWIFAGPVWARRYFDRIECLLTERSLVYKKGILFRSETTIPLDQIQDLTVKYGPVLDWLGIAKLTVVTAGQHANQGAAAGLVGVVDAGEFRDAVLAQRDRWVDRLSGSGTGGVASLPVSEVETSGRGAGETGATGIRRGIGAEGPGTEALAEVPALLREIRDTLRRMEGGEPGPGP